MNQVVFLVADPACVAVYSRHDRTPNECEEGSLATKTGVGTEKKQSDNEDKHAISGAARIRWSCS